MKIIPLILALAISAPGFLSCGISHAGTITGRVLDAKDKTPIAGATVFLVGTHLGGATDTLGRYAVNNVPVGEYTIRISMVGYRDQTIREKEVDAESDTVHLDVNLAGDPTSMAEIVVRGRMDNELESSGRILEKNSSSVINVITAQTIERSTDLTAADALQRVSGLSLSRNAQGGGRYVIMRGLEQRYNNTLVDGIKIPSPESKDRFVPMDIFPSALFERIEVTKALTPEIAGDAIGGSANLIFRDAPEGFLLRFSAGAGSSSGLLNRGFSGFDRNAVNELDPDRLNGTVSDADPTTQLKPRANPTSAAFTVKNLKFTNRKTPLDGLYSLLIGNRFFDERFGLIASGSYQHTFDRVQTDFYSLGSNVNNIDNQGHLIPFDASRDTRSYYNEKMRGGVAIKADFIADTEHELFAEYVLVRQEELQTRHALQVNVSGTRGASDLTYTNRSALRTQNISSVSLRGDHFTDSPICLRWALNYTDALQDRPDEAEYSLLQNYDPYGNIQAFQGLGEITHNWRKNDDHQELAKVDAVVHLTADGMHTIQTGVVFQKLNRVNYQNDYKLNPAILNGHTQPFTTIEDAITTVFGYGSTSGTSVYGYQNYKADETLLSSYAQYTFTLGSLEILGGVRWEEARDTYFTQAPASVGHNQAKVTTVDLLPGIHFRYEFTPENIGRLSLTQTMSRPSYFDLVPASDRSDNSQSQGNPNLRPAHSTNLDVRYEYYPNPWDQYSIGFYYKKITDPIEDQFNSVGVVFVTTKGNGNPADVYGFEAVVVKRFGDFGVSANYSYVLSKITNTKLAPHLDVYGDPVIPVPGYQQTRPLVSQSPMIANVTLSYQNESWGTGANVSYNYTGRRLIAVAQIDGYDTYEDGVGELDFSAEQTILSRFKLNVKITNLLNAEVITEVDSGDYIKHSPLVIQKDYNKMRGSIGIAYRF